MEKRSMRRTVILVGLIMIALLAACVIVAYFLFGANLEQVRVSDYVITSRVGDHFEFSLDTDRLLWEKHLLTPPDYLLKDYPEIDAVRSLGLYVTHDDAGYHFETVSSSNDPAISRTLRKAGIVLKGTQWSWTETDIIGKNATQPTDGFTELSLPDYVRISVENNAYRATLDTQAMVEACRFQLPLDPTEHSGYAAITSLLIDCQPTGDGVYRLQAQSTLKTIMEQLQENHVRITNTVWTWTEAEMAARAGAAPAADNAQAAAPETHETPAPSESPRSTERREGITSLYGFDQTAVRIAIRNAKELHYGSQLESGKVYQNYFAVGTADTEHSNVFRVIYDISTTGGTEYLIADVYDLDSESGYTADDVVLRTASSRSEARSTEDLKYYTIYTLTGGSMIFPENEGKSPFDADGFVMAKSISTALTYDELWDIPATQDWTLVQLLAFARNEMYARAGHQYDTSGSYYKHFSSYSWYEPVGTVSLSELAEKWPITGTNISTIKFLEKLISEG
ncbi:MAG: YARHG domain-containing protein [Clostridia bacterium]|nr:YARHG domain-containing protein [Clostridia bacterium]